jgi:hypothetical protein
MQRFPISLASALILLVASVAPVQAGYLVAGVPTITLDTSGISGYPMNVAWHPVYNQYYGGGGGFPGASGRVWDAAGSVVQTLTPINDDLRGFYYNPNSGNLEQVAYGSKSVGTAPGSRRWVDWNGPVHVFATVNHYPASAAIKCRCLQSNEPTVCTILDGSPTTVEVTNRATGLSAGSVTLNLVAAGIPALSYVELGYDPFNNALISFTTSGGNRALAFDAATGAFLASISLPGLGSPDTNYAMGYTNNQFFIWDAAANLYRGFISDGVLSAVPEPGTLSLFGLGALGLLTARRRRQTLAA